MCSLQPNIMQLFLSGDHLPSLAEKIRTPLAHLCMLNKWNTVVKERLQILGIMRLLILQYLRCHLKPIKV